MTVQQFNLVGLTTKLRELQAQIDALRSLVSGSSSFDSRVTQLVRQQLNQARFSQITATFGAMEQTDAPGDGDGAEILTELVQTGYIPATRYSNTPPDSPTLETARRLRANGKPHEVWALSGWGDKELALILSTTIGRVAIPLTASAIRRVRIKSAVTPMSETTGEIATPGKFTFVPYQPKPDADPQAPMDEWEPSTTDPNEYETGDNWSSLDVDATNYWGTVGRDTNGNWVLLTIDCNTEVPDGGGGGAITQPPMLDELADVTVSPTEPSGAPAGEFWVEATPQAPSVNPVAVALDDLVDVTVAASEPAGLSDGAFWVDTR